MILLRFDRSGSVGGRNLQDQRTDKFRPVLSSVHSNSKPRIVTRDIQHPTGDALNLQDFHLTKNANSFLFVLIKPESNKENCSLNSVYARK